MEGASSSYTLDGPPDRIMPFGLSLFVTISQVDDGATNAE